jgi:putative CocE/NonD family hydrolase
VHRIDRDIRLLSEKGKTMTSVSFFRYAALALMLCAPLARGGEYGLKAEKSIMVPMRDGVVLSTDLHFPEGAEGPLPTILIRTVYSKNATIDWNPAYRILVSRGYVVAIQDVRGRYESEGAYVVATHRREDGYDTVDWLVSQPWSNGKVGTAGCSYLGETQVVLAAAKHPSHVAAIPMSAASGFYAPGRAWSSFDGGVFELAQTAGWFADSGTQVFYGPPPSVDRQEWFRSPAAKLFAQAPKIDFQSYLELVPTLPTFNILQRAGLPPTEYEEFATHLPDDPYFRNKDWVQASDTFNVPAIFMDSWYDYGPAETLEMFRLFQENAETETAKNNQFLIMGPSTHCAYTEATEHTVVGERDLGDARLDFLDIQLRWYDYWLKGIDNGITDMPKVRYYVMGLNTWQTSDHWPPPGTTYQRWYLSSGGRANSRNGDGVLSVRLPSESGSDSFTYDPAYPVPSLGGHTCCTGMDTEAGGYDQSAIELRDDVLVYTSQVLTEGIEVTGALQVELFVSSSAPDTDFTAKLVDVYPDGRAFNVQEGALRMRHREGLSTTVTMEAGEVYRAPLDLHATSNYFAKGHRIRLEISSSNFPRWQRNLNTGGNNYDETEMKVAKNTVHHSAEHPSNIVLPVIVRDSKQLRGLEPQE